MRARSRKAIAEDPRVDSVVGPGAFVAQSEDLQALPEGLEDSAKLLKGGKRDLGRLENGLGQAGAGAVQLRAGLGERRRRAPGKLQGGLRERAGSGAGQAPGRARAGARRRRGRSPAASRRARRREALERGAGRRSRAPDAERRRSATARRSVKAGCRSSRSSPRDVGRQRPRSPAAHGRPRSPHPARSASALDALKGMSVGQDDPATARRCRALQRGAERRRPASSRRSPASSRS